jgi:hypothetical protein
MLVLILAYLVPHLIYMSIARYQAPIVPVLALLAAAPFAWLKLPRLHGKRRKKLESAP